VRFGSSSRSRTPTWSPSVTIFLSVIVSKVAIFADCASLSELSV
jgi:hypothetical protein